MGLFKKPNVEPPPGLPDPDFDAFNDLIKKYQDEYETNLFAGNLSDVVRIKEAMDDLFDIEFTGIKYFLRSTKTSAEMVEIARLRNMYTSAATSASWMIGREWASRDDLLRKRLEQKNAVDTDDVPSDAMALLNKAAYLPYWLFTSVMSDYYDSPFGERTRYQKEAHLLSMYQSFMKGVLMCFLVGAKYNTLVDGVVTSISITGDRTEIRIDQRESNWPLTASLIIAFVIAVFALIGGSLLSAVVYGINAFLSWWISLSLIQMAIIKIKGKKLNEALGTGTRSNYLFFIALFIGNALFYYRLGMSYGNMTDAIFGSVTGAIAWYFVLYVLRAIFRAILRYFRNKIADGAIERSNILLITLLVFVFGLIASAVIFANPEKPTVAQVAAAPTARPTQKPTPRPTNRPTVTTRPLMLTVTAVVARDRTAGTVDGCYLWSMVTLADKGKTLCVYGTARSTYHREGTFYVPFGTDNDDFYFVSYGDFWYDDMKGNCVMAEGKVEQIGKAPVIVVPENKFYHCD